MSLENALRDGGTSQSQSSPDFVRIMLCFLKYVTEYRSQCIIGSSHGMRNEMDLSTEVALKRSSLHA
jgi:hypothetical protein